MVNKNRIDPVNLSVLAALIATALYIYIYQMQPLPLPWNDTVLNFSYCFAAGSGALLATLIWRRFAPADRPRRVWGNLALGLWMWTVAEAAWAAYVVIYGEAPGVSVADVLWFAGYVFFAAALLHQYLLLFRPSLRRALLVLAAVTVGVLLISLLFTGLAMQSADSDKPWLETYVAIFYPLGDLAVAAAALYLVRTFGWGLWGRPWLALLVFTVSDALYAWLEITGLYNAISASGNLGSMVVDVLYFAAYLVMALACYWQWRLLKYGPQRQT